MAKALSLCLLLLLCSSPILLFPGVVYSEDSGGDLGGDPGHGHMRDDRDIGVGGLKISQKSAVAPPSSAPSPSPSVSNAGDLMTPTLVIIFFAALNAGYY